MNEQECLSKMIAPSQVRPSKPYLGGVIQILVTSSCNENCFNCTQLSQMRAKPWFMTPEQFEQAVLSLSSYWGVVGMFGGNPAISPYFKTYCEIMRKHVPFQQRGIWCNNPLTIENARTMRETFNPGFSNLNCHMDVDAFRMFKEGWPESNPFGHDRDSRHSPCFVAMKDLVKVCELCNGNGEHSVHSGGPDGDEWVECDACDGTGLAPGDLPVFDADHKQVGTMPNTEENRLTLISDCDVNQRWSAGIGVFRGELRAWFCEIAMAQSIAHQWDMQERGIDGKMQHVYPDTGICIDPLVHSWNGHDAWWKMDMRSFAHQVKKHCHECSVPLRGHGELAMTRDVDLADMDGGIIQNAGKEQVSKTHLSVCQPKRKGRQVEVVTGLVQLGVPLQRTTDYLGNAKVR